MGYCTIPGVGFSGGISSISRLLQLHVKVFYVMGNCTIPGVGFSGGVSSISNLLQFLCVGQCTARYATVLFCFCS